MVPIINSPAPPSHYFYVFLNLGRASSINYSAPFLPAKKSKIETSICTRSYVYFVISQILIERSRKIQIPPISLKVGLLGGRARCLRRGRVYRRKTDDHHTHPSIHPPQPKNPLTDQRTGPVPSNTRKSSYFGEFSYEAHVTSIASLTRLSYLAQ